MNIWGVILVYIGYISGISQVYLSYIFGISQTYLRFISGISRLFSVISQVNIRYEYLRNFSGISQAYLRLRHLSDIASPTSFITMPQPKKSYRQLARRKYGDTSNLLAKDENDYLSARLRETLLFIRPGRQSLNLHWTSYRKSSIKRKRKVLNMN